MAQIGMVKLDATWKPFTDITTPTSDMYFIQNRGQGTLLAQESASTPTTNAGVIVKPDKVLSYKAGSDTLYLKAVSGACVINVTKAE